MIEFLEKQFERLFRKIFPCPPNHILSDEIIEAIFEEIPRSEIDRVWEKPTKEEYARIVKRAWQLVDEKGYCRSWLLWGQRIYRYPSLSKKGGDPSQG